MDQRSVNFYMPCMVIIQPSENNHFTWQAVLVCTDYEQTEIISKKILHHGKLRIFIDFDLSEKKMLGVHLCVKAPRGLPLDTGDIQKLVSMSGIEYHPGDKEDHCVTTQVLFGGGALVENPCMQALLKHWQDDKVIEIETGYMDGNYLRLPDLHQTITVRSGMGNVTYSYLAYELFVTEVTAACPLKYYASCTY